MTKQIVITEQEVAKVCFNCIMQQNCEKGLEKQMRCNFNFQIQPKFEVVEVPEQEIRDVIDNLEVKDE